MSSEKEKPFMPKENRVPGSQLPGWKIRPTMAPAKMPRVMPGMAGIFMATATMTITGGSSRMGLMWNTPPWAMFRALANSVTRLISASPPWYWVTPSTPKKIIQMT